MKYIKLSDYAKNMSITYRTAWNHYKRGLIDGAFKDKLGNIFIPKQIETDKTVAIYCRVSSSEMKENLDRQLDRLIEYSNRNNFKINKSVKEIGSGMNDQRPKLIKLLQDKSWDILLIEHKDRLTRFGFNYIQTLLELQDRKIIVVNNQDSDKNSLMEDLVSIIYSFSARMYGLRKKRNKEDIIKFIES